ncbi:hypothetical protein PHMEG_00015177 [Phytophthora megakarya]|uniref:Uncharacterized protein n=1 Tax=Phytophthora megakarya TaxID=4795 RepID=A0A225W2Z5_9STRA|nr:hypothetical protein PHMEG_00015177 [Phytophthora megakarya]
MDTYNVEFSRLACTAGVSENIKISRYKQGLSSMLVLNLLKGHRKECCWMLYPELQSKWLKDMGKKKVNATTATLETTNSFYFERRREPNLQHEIQITKTFFDEGADFCGISKEFVEKMNCWILVKDLCSMKKMTYANCKTEVTRNQTIRLTVFIDSIPGYSTDFQLCHIFNQCKLMLSVPWKNARNPVIDWETDRIYTKEEFAKVSLPQSR